MAGEHKTGQLKLWSTPSLQWSLAAGHTAQIATSPGVIYLCPKGQVPLSILTSSVTGANRGTTSDGFELILNLTISTGDWNTVEGKLRIAVETEKELTELLQVLKHAGGHAAAVSHYITTTMTCYQQREEEQPQQEENEQQMQHRRPVRLGGMPAGRENGGNEGVVVEEEDQPSSSEQRTEKRRIENGAGTQNDSSKRRKNIILTKTIVEGSEINLNAPTRPLQPSFSGATTPGYLAAAAAAGVFLPPPPLAMDLSRASSASPQVAATAASTPRPTADNSVINPAAAAAAFAALQPASSSAAAAATPTMDMAAVFAASMPALTRATSSSTLQQPPLSPSPMLQQLQSFGGSLLHPSGAASPAVSSNWLQTFMGFSPTPTPTPDPLALNGSGGTVWTPPTVQPQQHQQQLQMQ
ncbi:hypothetical protein PENTCL1PPCAC_12001, partial [Pristionchus entomophagus]